MQTVPAKNYTPLSGLNQLCLPMDVGVLIPPDDSVRLLVFVLKQLTMKPLYDAYAAYGEKRRWENPPSMADFPVGSFGLPKLHLPAVGGQPGTSGIHAARKREAAERGAGKLPAVDEAEAAAPRPRGEREKKKDGRPPCDMLVLLAVVIYGYMEGVYSSRDLAKACRQNINFMWLPRGNPPPSHGMLNAFRKHLLGAAIEALLYEVVRFLGDCGEVTFTQAFIDGTMVEAQANRHTAVWRKNLDRYEEGQREKIRGIIREVNRSEGTAFSEAGEGIPERAQEVQTYIETKLAEGGSGGTLSRKALKTYRHTLKACIKKLNTYGKQREIMGKRNSYSRTDPDATFMRMKDESLKAAYNVQLAVEGEYITGAGVFATTNDGVTLTPFLERLKQMLGTTYQKVVADAGYDSEENYAYLAENKQRAYIKPATYERMKTKRFKNDISKRENMAYDGIRDEYTCANHKKLRAVGTERRVSKSGYESEVTVYESEGCEGCPFREGCTASKKNRRMEVSKKGMCQFCPTLRREAARDTLR